MEIRFIKKWQMPYNGKTKNIGDTLKVTNNLGEQLIKDKVAVKAKDYNTYLIGKEKVKQLKNNKNK